MLRNEGGVRSRIPNVQEQLAELDFDTFNASL